MANNESEFQLRITADASELAAESKKASTELAGVGEAAKQSGQGLDKSTESAKKAFASKKDLKDAVKGLTAEFPLLARVAHLALNPIAFMVAAASAAFTIFKARIEAATQVMAGFKYPDISDDQVERINAAAEAWKNFAEAMGKAVDSNNSVDAVSDRVTKRLQAQAEQQKKVLAAQKELELAELESRKGSMSKADYQRAKLAIEDRYAAAGIQADEGAKKAELAEKARRRANLILDAQGKVSEAARIRVGTADQDAKTEDKLKKANDEALKAQAETRQRLYDIADLESRSTLDPRRLYYDLRFRKHYGYGTTYDQARALEHEGMQSAQNAIDAYNDFMARKADREGARGRRGELLSAAGAEVGEAWRIGQELPGDVAAFNQEAGVNRRVAGMGGLSRAYGALGESNEELERLANEITKQGQAAGRGHKAAMESYRAQEQFNEEVIRHIERLREQIKNARNK